MIPNHTDRFFTALRTGLLGPTLSPGEVAGCNALLTACKAWPTSWTAYALATAYHETAHTMQPITEYGGEAYFRRMYDLTGNRPEVARELGNIHPGDGALYCGRGYVQLTGRRNYAKCGIADEPAKALQPDIAASILEQGMRQGWFSRRKLGDFLPLNGPATRAQFMAARWVINRQDRADLIADYGLRFQDALFTGGCT